MNVLDNEQIGHDPYRVFFELSAEGIWRMELEVPVSISLSEDDQMDALYRYGYFAECNDAMARMYGFSSAADFNGIRLSDLLPRTDPANIQALRDFIRSGYRLTDSESHEVDKEGRALYFMNNLMGVVNEGHLKTVWGTQRNITVAKEAADKLRFQAGLLDAVGQAVIYADVDGTIRYWNHFAETLYGWSAQEAIGRQVSIVVPESLRTVDLEIRSKNNTAQPVSTELTLQRKDRSTFPALIATCPVLDTKGTLIGTIGVSNDISRLKQMETSLRESEERYRLVNQATNDLLFDWDMKNNKVFLEESFFEHLHFPKLEIADHSDWWLGRIHPDDIVRVRKEMNDVTRNPSQNTLVSEYRFLDGENSYRHLHSRTFYLRDEEGRLTRAVGALQDITERKQMEEDLKQQRDRLRLALEIGQMGGWEWDAKKQLLLWHYNIDQAHGYPEGSFNGEFSAYMEMVHPDDHERVMTALSRAYQETEWQTNTFRVIDAEGKIRWTEGRFQSIKDESGETYLMRGVSIDITERKQMEEDLRQSEERFASFMENLPAVAWIKDEAGCYTYVNAAFEKTQNQPLSEILGKREHDLWPEEAADLFEASDRTVLETLNPLETQEVSHYDGELCHTWVTKFPIQGKNGLTQIGGIAIDVTERKRAELRQASLIQGLKTVVEIADELLSASDMDTLMLLAVERVRERLGLERCAIFLLNPEGDTAWGTYGTDIQGNTYDEHDNGFVITSRNWIEPILKLNFSAPGTPRWFYSPDNPFYGRDSTLEDKRVLDLGKTGWVVATPILSAQGPRGIMYNDTAISDTPVDEITQELMVIYCSLVGNLIERQQALDELKKSQQQIIQQERLRAVGEMASGIAHDVNNSLAPISGFTELLLLRPEYLSDVEKTKRYLSNILLASQDAAQTISRLKEFFRRRQEQETFHPVDLNLILKQVVELTEPRWKSQALGADKNIEIRLILSEIPHISGDEVSLREALTNLIFNSVDALPASGGTITISTNFDTVRKLVQVEVSDTGIGMNEATRLHCLEPFFTTKGPQGTGMGLSMTYGIVQRHNGLVEIESEEGVGTTFRLSFVAQKMLETSVIKVGEKPTAQGTLRIFIVEDEPLVGEMITSMLLEGGHSVESAKDGVEGLAKFLESEFDLVITDRAMPKMNGDKLALAVKERKPNVPVILLTGFGELMGATGEHPPGVDLVLSKPVSLNDLAKAIRQVTLREEMS